AGKGCSTDQDCFPGQWNTSALQHHNNENCRIAVVCQNVLDPAAIEKVHLASPRFFIAGRSLLGGQFTQASGKTMRSVGSGSPKVGQWGHSRDDGVGINCRTFFRFDPSWLAASARESSGLGARSQSLALGSVASSAD